MLTEFSGSGINSNSLDSDSNSGNNLMKSIEAPFIYFTFFNIK